MDGLNVYYDSTNRVCNTETNGIDQQNKISDAFRRTIPPRVISVSNSELEIELANLVYGHPENDYAENPRPPRIFKSTEVQLRTETQLFFK